MKMKEFMEEAIKLSSDNFEKRYGGPFGAVVVKDGKIIGRGMNMVIKNNDPTAVAMIKLGIYITVLKNL